MLRLIPSSAWKASQIYQLLLKQNWFKIAIFYTSDIFGIDSLTTFDNVNVNKEVRVLASESFPSETIDFSSYISNVQNSGATIIVLFMSEDTTIRLLAQAYDQGLLQSGVVVIGTSDFKSTANLKSMMNQTRLAEVFNSYISLRNAPELYFQIEKGRLFLEQYRSLSPTIIVNDDDGSISCDNRCVINQCLYFYEYGNYNCTGIESFEVFNDSNIDANILYTYTGVQLAALAMDYLVEAGEEVTGERIYEVLTNISSISKNGQNYIETAIGNVSFSKGNELQGYFGKGDRQSGHLYKVLQHISIEVSFIEF